MCFYGSGYNVSAGLCVFMVAYIMYQQDYVFLWERIKCISNPLLPASLKQLSTHQRGFTTVDLTFTFTLTLTPNCRFSTT